MKQPIASTLAVVFLCAFGTVAWSQTYSVTDLGPIAPVAINTWGQVVGNYNGDGFMWTRFGGLKDLGILQGGTFSSAASINDLGTVTGTADGPGTVISLDPLIQNEYCSSLVQPFLWTQRNGIQGLGTVGPTVWEYSPGWCNVPFSATGINAVDKVVGYTAPDLTFQYGFRRTSSGDMTLFGGSWPSTYAMAVSNTGQIVGQNTIDNSYIGHATQWRDDLTTDLGTLGSEADYASFANGANDLGKVVGWSTTTPIYCCGVGFPVHAVLWTPGGGIRDLGTLPGDASSAASKVNFFGQVVGSSGNDYYQIYDFTGHYPPFEVNGRAFIWSERRGMRDLNSLISSSSGWVLNSATDINIWGQIVGSGTINGQPHGFLLTPKRLF